MLLIENFPLVMAQIEKERGIDRQTILEAVSQALIAACRKKFGNNADNLEVTIDPESGETRVFANREVAAEITDSFTQISLPEAKKINDQLELEDVIQVEVTPSDFGRLAAQTAKQVIMQRIREAEKKVISKEFNGKIGEIVTGTVQRQEGRNYLINLGHVEALLRPRDQIPRETDHPKDLIKVFVVGVEQLPRGPQVVISRSHPGLVKKLFELEVPEVHDKVIEIKAVAREAGFRTKIAVASKDSNVSAVGTCVGHMGQRIQAILKEMGQERVDIIEWSADEKAYINASMKPAKIESIEMDTAHKKAKLHVAPDQLSLAIGRSGQNVRLASKLTGWELEIINPTPVAEAVVEVAPDLASAEMAEGEKAPEEIGVEVAETAEAVKVEATE